MLADAPDLIHGDLEVRPRDLVALGGGRVLRLSMREFALLATLASAPQRVATREELYGAAWGRGLRADDRSVDVYVHRLRCKLRAASPEWEYIHTHFGLGYRFAAERARVQRADPVRSQPFHRSATTP